MYLYNLLYKCLFFFKKYLILNLFIYDSFIYLFFIHLVIYLVIYLNYIYYLFVLLLIYLLINFLKKF